MREEPLDALDRLYFGRYAEDLSDLIERQSAEVFRQAGLIVPVKSCSLLAAVAAHGPANMTDLAQRLGRSHQLVQQKIPKLVALKVASRAQSPEEARSVLIAITDEGRRQLAILATLRPAFERAYAELEREVGPVLDLIRKSSQSLTQRPLAARMGPA